MKTTIVTTGQPFTDIDALACAIGYTELLKLESINANTILPGPLNNSITKEIKSWELKYLKTPLTENANYVLVDISDPKYFAKFVKENSVTEIYDHRYGFEDYWEKKLGRNSHIEMVGSCATLIWEEFVKKEKQKKISKTSANLLSLAIISNTLNFKASVTTKRDKKALKELSVYTNLPKNWVEKYFEQRDIEITNDLESAVINDTKELKPIIAQLELWDSQKIIKNHIGKIENIMNNYGTSEWFLTSPSISEGKNYLFTKNSKIKRLLDKTIGSKFTGDIGITKKLWLRKEIWKKIN